MTSPTVLIVEDSQSFLKLVAAALEDDGLIVHTAVNSVQALLSVEMERPDVVLLDVFLGEESGIDLLIQILERQPGTPVIMMTSSDEMALVVQAMQLGAAEYFIKPLDLLQVRQLITNLTQDKDDRHRFVTIEKTNPLDGSLMVGSAPKILEIFKTIGRISKSKATVLIEGESGTGKEVLARSIHRASCVSGEPFVGVNCSAIPENLFESELFGHIKGSFTGATADRKGMFEQASDGTLLLDEVGTLPPSMQVKLLRAIQEREFTPVGSSITMRTSARIIAASNIPLIALVKKDLFREDLYYRLNVVPMHLPPLRDRREDIPRLVAHFIRKVNRSHATEIWKLNESTLYSLCAYDWPGNIRQLEHVLTRAMILASGGTLDIPELRERSEAQEVVEQLSQLRWERPLEEVEIEHILRVLDAVQGNRTKAALVLGISKPTLYAKLKKLGIASRGI